MKLAKIYKTKNSKLIVETKRGIKMINLEEINANRWKEILYSSSPDDIETNKFLKEHEEEILDILIENSAEKSIDEKRIEYVRNILVDHSYHTDIEEVIEKIEEIREKNGYSILQFGKRLFGSSFTVFAFGDKVIKLGKYYKILNDPNILQPEFQMNFGSNNNFMTVYERLPEIFARDDFEIAQEMYNRVRDNAVLWFDAIGNNVGRTNKRRDEEDDGLRIIDAQYMEYERDVLVHIDPERDARYQKIGIAMYNRAIHDYIIEKGYGYNEKCYQEMKQKRSSSKEDVEVVAKQSDIKGLQKIKEFFSRVFHKREGVDRDDK